MVKKRSLNEVDRLLKKVRNIQGKCKHDFHLKQKHPKLTESFVKGVYIGFTSGPIKIKEEGDGGFGLTLVCSRCSKEKKTTIIEDCPYCLGSMRDEGIQNSRQIEGKWVRPRTIYFGEEHLYYSISLYRCPGCGFTVACDEWNQ